MAGDILIDGRTLYIGDDAGATIDGDDSGLYHRDTRHLSKFETRLEGVDIAPLGHDFDGSNRRTVVVADVGSGVNSVSESNPTNRATLTLRVDQTVREGAGLGQAVEVSNYATAFDGRPHR